MTLKVAGVLLVSIASSGCGILAQTIVGWNTEEIRVTRRTHEVRIESTPEGAQVTRSEGQSEPKVVGATPLVDRVEYEVEETVSSPRAWALLGTGIAEVVVGGVLAGVGRATQNQKCVLVAGVPCENTGGTPFFVAGGAVLVFGAIDVIWGLTRLFSSDEITDRKITEKTYTYSVERGGITKSADVLVPTAPGAKIDLGTGEISKPVVPPPAPPSDPRIVAVMDVENASDSVGEELARNLSDQLRIFVAQQGIKTIDRSAQERALRAQLQALKTESYEECYDDSCQVELGKAVAASHILRSKISNFGSRCVLNGELIDLTREVTIKAASAQGACQAEGFLEMSEAVARDLMKQ
jgi:hypothetical protein